MGSGEKDIPWSLAAPVSTSALSGLRGARQMGSRRRGADQDHSVPFSDCSLAYPISPTANDIFGKWRANTSSVATFVLQSGLSTLQQALVAPKIARPSASSACCMSTRPRCLPTQ